MGQASVRRPVEHPGGDRSIYVENPEGNTVEVWTSFAAEAAPGKG